MNRLYLVRHGENYANLTLEFSHRKVDYSLTPKGQLQAAQTAAYLAGLGVDAVYSSPLKRAMETAQAIASPLGLAVISSEAFREVNVGALEGQPPTAALWAQHNTVIAAWRDGHPETRFPDGEDYPTLIARVRSGLIEVLRDRQDQNIVIVGHGGIFTFTLRDLVPDVDFACLNQGLPNCSIMTLDVQLVDGRLDARVRTYASVGHLTGEAANLISGVMNLSGAEPRQE
ncbi:MAG TPA: histidine phosphatase family protein [Anaerolineaceae bacterium]